VSKRRFSARLQKRMVHRAIILLDQSACMKKIIFLIVLIGFVLTAFSQRLPLNGYGGHMFDDGFDSSYNPNTFLVGKINGGDQLGSGLEYMIRQGYCFELHYLHQTTAVPYTYQLGVADIAKSESITLTIDCSKVSGNGHMQSSSGKVEGNGDLFIGSAHLR
jgi:hypothetical protein